MTKTDRKLAECGFTMGLSRDNTLKYFKITGTHKIVVSIEVVDNEVKLRAYDMNLANNRIGIKNAFLSEKELKLFCKKLKELR